MISERDARRPVDLFADHGRRFYVPPSPHQPTTNPTQPNQISCASVPLALAPARLRARHHRHYRLNRVLFEAMPKQTHHNQRSQPRAKRTPHTQAYSLAPTPLFIIPFSQPLCEPTSALMHSIARWKPTTPPNAIALPLSRAVQFSWGCSGPVPLLVASVSTYTHVRNRPEAAAAAAPAANGGSRAVFRNLRALANRPTRRMDVRAKC